MAYGLERGQGGEGRGESGSCPLEVSRQEWGSDEGGETSDNGEFNV